MEKCLGDAEALACLIEQLPDSQLGEDFVDAKYGNYYRCLHGLVEHCHYHLGQIALIKSIVVPGVNLGNYRVEPNTSDADL